MRIEVWDTGVGIPEGQLHTIFTEFHQPGNPEHDHSLSFGLGLPIVQRLGQVLGHAIHVQSRPGKGSLFTIEAPLGGKPRDLVAARPVSDATPHTTEQAARPTASPTRHGLQASARRATIFVVDDESALREAMRELLQSEGWTVEAYPSGRSVPRDRSSGSGRLPRRRCQDAGNERCRAARTRQSGKCWAAGYHDYRPCRRQAGRSGDEGWRHGIPRKACSIRRTGRQHRARPAVDA